MTNIKELSKKSFLRSQKRNTIISKKLRNEIELVRKFLSEEYRKRYKRKKNFTIAQASDYIADIVRNQRYKIKYGRK